MGSFWAFYKGHALHYGDITRVHDGSCRLHPEMARAVVAACRVAQEMIDADVTWLKAMVMDTREV